MSIKWFNRKQLAVHLGKTPKAIQMMKDRGQLPYRKFHGQLYFNVNEIDKMIEASDGLRLEQIENTHP